MRCSSRLPAHARPHHLLHARIHPQPAPFRAQAAAGAAPLGGSADNQPNTAASNASNNGSVPQEPASGQPSGGVLGGLKRFFLGDKKLDRQRLAELVRHDSKRGCMQGCVMACGGEGWRVWPASC